MMNYKDFYAILKKDTNAFLPAAYTDAEVVFSTVTKNNGIKMDCIQVCPADVTDSSSIAITLYIEDLYQRYKRFEGNMAYLYVSMKSTIENSFSGLTKDSIVEKLISYDKAKNHIYPKLINKESNEELLLSHPHRTVADLAEIYYILLDNINGNTATAVVSTNHMNNWKISAEELHEAAWDNLKKTSPDFKNVLETMFEVMVADMVSVGMPEKIARAFAEEELSHEFDQPQGTEPIYVLTNKSKNLGSIWALDYNTMSMIREQLGDNFVILPSSIHEVLILNTGDEPEINLAQMVTEINTTRVADVEVLSNHVYRYDFERKTLVIAA